MASNGSGPLTVKLPLPLNLGNSRMHWRPKQRARREYEESCDLLHALKKIPRPPGAPIAKAVIAVEMIVHGIADQDNAVARCKWAVDWLVKRGYLAGDSPKHLRWAGFPTQRLDRKAPAVLYITITPDLLGSGS